MNIPDITRKSNATKLFETKLYLQCNFFSYHIVISSGNFSICIQNIVGGWYWGSCFF